MRVGLLSPLLAVALAAASTLQPPAPTPIEKPDVRFPQFSGGSVAPSPPDPGVVPTLAKGQYYVIAASKPQVIIAEGTGSVMIQSRKPPFSLPKELAIGWAPSDTDPDFITWDDPYIYAVKGKTTGSVSLMCIPALNSTGSDGKQIPLTASDIQRRAINVNMGTGPQPPPNPVDPPVPVPVVTSPFGNAPGLHVLIVYQDDVANRYPITQQSVLFGAEFREYLRTKCAKDATGNPQRRIYNSSVDLSSAPKLWQDAFAHVKKKQTVKNPDGSLVELDKPLPWIIVGNGDKWEEGPLPKTVPEAITLAKKYGG